MATKLKLIVHEEIRLPKSWIGIGDSTRFNATVIGQGRSLAIDPFSFSNAMVVHYLVDKKPFLTTRSAPSSNATSDNTYTTTPIIFRRLKNILIHKK